MNMFKSRRKAKDQSDALDTLTRGQSPLASSKTSKSLKRRNKNMPEDTKPVFDLSTALPDDNNFRTSLLMPNLSARFSMLREQDDPSTKMGKASDDSVLFPKRVSRMNLFNHNLLPDLVEVESEHSTFRPPFADRERSNSVGDGYDSDGGGIINRSRAGEGNNLFGGRLKFYKIANQSTRNASDTHLTANGRDTHEPDVSLPRQLSGRREKETYLSVEDYRASVPTTEGEDSSDIASPATAFSKNRGTQSSTNSAPRRSSTAATSVASESPVFRNSNSTEDGVMFRATDGLLPSENNSALLVSKTREDSIPNRFLSNSKRSGYQRPMPIYASTSLRNASSPVVPMSQPLDFGFKNDSRSASATGRYQTDSPTPSSVAENDGVLAGSVQPNDRGKATALGLFNKPAREFDEDQFNQRQLQMHEGQVSSMSNNSRSGSRASDEGQRAPQSSMSAVTKPAPVIADQESTLHTPPVHSTPTSSVPNSNRVSKVSTTSSLRPRSKSSTSIITVSNVKARIESLIRKQNAELVALEAEKLGSPNLKDFEDLSENKENYAGAFFDNGSDTEGSNLPDGSRANSSYVDESHIHPAFRNSHRVSDGHSRRSNYSNVSRTRSVIDDGNESFRLQIPKIETETVPPPTGPGLSGLIRTHLRQDSDKSSILPRPDSSHTPSINQPSQRVSVASTFRTAAASLTSDSVGLDVNHGTAQQRQSQPPLAPTTAMSQVAQQFLSRAMAMKDAAEKDQVEDFADVTKQKESSPTPKSWREDLEPKHQRGESSETTKERREFDEELAARRNRVKEGLKSVAERDRSQSPATAARVPSVTMQAFVEQRVATDPQPKAMKMLGLQSRDGHPGTPDDGRGRNTTSRSEQRGCGPEHSFNNRTANYARFDPSTTFERPQAPRSATPPAIRQGRRDRSNSNVGNRSRSRPGQSEQNPPVPSGRDYFTNWSQSTTDLTEESYDKPDSHVNRRNGYQAARPTPPDVSGRLPARYAAKPSPISPPGAYDSSVEAGKASPISTGRTTPSGGRATPTNAFNRKRSVTKTMISEPTFLSSTSSVPLVHLPEAQHTRTPVIPPLPKMSPRRRGNTTCESPVLSPSHSNFPRSTPLEPVPASPVVADFGTDSNGRFANSPSPRKLRKANSEGGSMAAKARQQAMAAELSQERIRSPAVPIFPNRSVTALGISNDGGMF